MSNGIYLDYNATTPIDPEVVDEMLPFIKEGFGNPSSSHLHGKKAKKAVDLARQRVANLINAQPNEIVFTSGGTESNNHAIKGIAFANQDKGKHIITSAIDHPAVTAVCDYLASLNWDITYLPVNNYGTVNVNDVKLALKENTALITVMHANNEVGTIQPIQEIATLANKHQIPFHTDAAQSVGKIETNVARLGVDLLSIAGHKIYAPKGIGALYIKKGTHIDPIMHGASQENNKRAGTENVPYIVALGKACEIAQRDFTKNTHTMLATKNKLINGLKSKLNHKFHINGHTENCLPNTLSISFEGIAAQALVNELADKLFISTGSACHNNLTTVSSVLNAMQIDTDIATGTVRISTGKHTSQKAIDQAINILVNAVDCLV